MEKTEKQAYVNGFIQGVVSLFEMGNDLENDLNMVWSFDENTHVLKCEYTIYSALRVVVPGTYNKKPVYEAIEERSSKEVELKYNSFIELRDNIYEILTDLQTLNKQILL
jgi:hypothetical protein